MDSFKNDLSVIAGYPEGRILEVDYFSQNKPLADVKTHTADLVTASKDDTHISWTEIRNFELRLPGEMSFEYNEDTNISEVNGEALVLAGFIPRASDIFLLELRNGKIGVFSISNIRRLAIGQDTYHQVGFTLQSYLDPETKTRLRRQTTIVSYFDKTKFLAGNHAFLSTEGYIQQTDLEHIRKEIIQNYMDRFYDTEYSSFMRPDGIYDPYVVDYWNKKISVTETNLRPTQLLISVQNFKKTIWSLLTNNPIKNLKNVSTDTNTATYHATFWSVNITSLLEKPYLTVGNERGAVGQVNAQGETIIGSNAAIFHSVADDVRIRDRFEHWFNRWTMWYPHYSVRKQKCPPHVMYNTRLSPWDEVTCDTCHHKNECEFHPKNDPHPSPVRDIKLTAPYPVMSSEELVSVWKKLRHIEEDAILTDNQMAQARGYLLWYREAYPGTLSVEELSEEWCDRAGVSVDDALSPEQQQALISYIRSYRAQFIAILTDREIEALYRLDNNLEFDLTLDSEEITKIQKVIRNYRQHHGNLPSDMVNSTDEVGTPMDPQAFDADKLLQQADNLIISDEATDADGLLPTIYYPKLHAHRFCPSLCAKMCDARHHEEKAQEAEDKSYYALSKEFYLGSSAMGSFEHLIFDAISNREVKVSDIVEAVSDYLSWSDEDAFYQELFAIYLIDKALFWLRFHS